MQSPITIELVNKVEIWDEQWCATIKFPDGSTIERYSRSRSRPTEEERQREVIEVLKECGRLIAPNPEPPMSAEEIGKMLDEKFGAG